MHNDMSYPRALVWTIGIVGGCLGLAMLIAISFI